MNKKLRKYKTILFIIFVVIFVSTINIDLTFRIHIVQAESKGNISITTDSQGIYVALANSFEFYFNATNGGEITSYYDLSSDPYRTNNLVLPVYLRYQQQSPYNLYPLFSSILYNPYVADFEAVGSTGGDGNATLEILGNGNKDGLEYVILQSTARITDTKGGIFEDVLGNANLVKSTWLIRSDGYIFLERTLDTHEYAVIPSRYRWYPFYSIRSHGFSNNAAFYLFNTTYAYTYSISKQNYRNNYTTYPSLPTDEVGYFGVAAPFSDTGIGGDGTNNFVLVYDLDHSTEITEWKSDCFTNSSGFGGTEFGAVHEFVADYNMTPTTYHAMIVLTHDSVTEQNVTTFANYFSKNQVFPLVKTALTTDKVSYEHGEPFIINVSATIDYNMMNLDKVLTLTDESGRVLWYEDYGVVNVSQNETWSNITLLNMPLSAMIASGNHTFTFNLLSEQGIVVGSDKVSVTYIVNAHQFGKTEIGKNNATSYANYKMVSTYLMPEDGWVTSISMWFGSSGFDAKVAIYTHPDGVLLVQSQSETITSIGWHNFTISRTFLFSGFYGLSWKNSEDTLTAYDSGMSAQTARTPELYSSSFSPTFGSNLQFFPLEASIYGTYDPIVAKVGVSNYPQTPSYDESVTVTAYASDGGILAGPVVLSYSTSANENWVSASMMPSSGVFTAQIPSHPYNTVVYYKVTAKDARGEPIVSGVQSYIIADLKPPTVSYLERMPVLPNYNETVTISAHVNEPINASGIGLAVLSYSNGSAWTDIIMTPINNTYIAVIPPLPFGTIVNYTVSASDNAQNTATLDIYSYEVVDMFLPIAYIGGLSQTSLKGITMVNVTGYDANFNWMELYISEQLVQSWNQSSSEVFYWDTTKYPDGDVLLKLIVYDKANNIGIKEIVVNIENVMSLSLIAIAAVSITILTIIGVYSTKWKKGRVQSFPNTNKQIKNTKVKIFVRVTLIASAVWFGYWIASEIIIWHKPLVTALTTSLINDFGLAFAILLLLSFETLQRFQRTKLPKNNDRTGKRKKNPIK